jgi:DNA polymerase-3 subunit delta'
MLFKDIIGQGAVKNQLIQIVNNNRISHALLFHGKGCVGKLPLALAMAQYVHCENPGTDDACGVCPSCKKHKNLAHPDMHYVFPVVNDKKRKPISDSYIEEWREMLKENPYFTHSQWVEFIKTRDSAGQGMIYSEESQEIIRKLSLKTYESEYKVIVIYEAARMNISAANKLLKILEEPTDKTLFMLTVDDADSLLPTIFSRCQAVHIGPIDKNELFDAMVKTAGYTPAQVTSAVNLSQGCYCRANACLESAAESSEKLGSFMKIMRHSYQGNVRGMIDWAEDTGRLHVDEQKQLLIYYSSQLRNNLMKTVNAGAVALMTAEEDEFSGKFHPFVHPNNITMFREEIEKAILHLERNGNATLILLDMAFTFHRLFKLPKN